MKVEKLMKTDVGTCRPGDSGMAAARIMWEKDCGTVPVVDDGSRVLGMITDRDLCIASYLEGKSLRDISVAGVMSKELWSCGPQDDILDAEVEMKSHQVRRLPVVDEDGHLEGILSLSDIALEAAAESDAGRKKVEVGYAGVAETLGDISIPHRRPNTATAS